MSSVKYQWSPRPAKFDKPKAAAPIERPKVKAKSEKPRRKWREFRKGQNASTCEIRHLHEIPQAEFAQVDLTSPRAGFSVSEKSQLDDMNRELRARQQRYFAENPPKPRPAGRHDSAGKHRLVKECKSPTKIKRAEEIASKHRALVAYERHLAEKGHTVSAVTDDPEIRYLGEPAALCNPSFSGTGAIDFETGEIRDVNQIGAGRSALVRLYGREWSNQYRVRVETSASPSAPPPQQAGERVTAGLTPSAVSKIIDAGAYVSAVREGMSTFFTLTFNDKSRKALAAGETTIGREVSRFFDGAQRIYNRGWQCRGKVLKKEAGFNCVGATANVPGIADKLDYIWVAENPGNDNPHVHILMRWQVEPWLFHDWAARLEKLWGHGFAKLERIKKPEAAGKYILKALGYFTKGADDSQGEIKGNRYGISKSARAPGWEVIDSFHAEHMASIIGEVKHKLEQRERPTLRTLGKLNTNKEKAIRDLAILNQHQPEKAAAVKKRLASIEQLIKQHAAFISERKQRVWARDFQLTVTGRESFNRFMGWAIGARSWSAQLRDGTQVNTTPFVNGYSAQRRRHEEKQAWWREILGHENCEQLEQWQLLLLGKGEHPPSEIVKVDFNQYEQWAMEI